jgi:hypothetical protein
VVDHVLLDPLHLRPDLRRLLDLLLPDAN